LSKNKLTELERVQLKLREAEQVISDIKFELSFSNTPKVRKLANAYVSHDDDKNVDSDTWPVVNKIKELGVEEFLWEYQIDDPRPKRTTH